MPTFHTVLHKFTRGLCMVDDIIRTNAEREARKHTGLMAGSTATDP